MSSFKGLVARIEDYVGSEAWIEDCKASKLNNGYNWIDISHRFGLFSGCINFNTLILRSSTLIPLNNLTAFNGN